MNIKWIAFKDKMPSKEFIYIHDLEKNTIEICFVPKWVNITMEEEWNIFLTDTPEYKDCLWAYIPMPKIKRLESSLGKKS